MNIAIISILTLIVFFCIFIIYRKLKTIQILENENKELNLNLAILKEKEKSFKDTLEFKNQEMNLLKQDNEKRIQDLKLESKQNLEILKTELEKQQKDFISLQKAELKNELNKESKEVLDSVFNPIKLSLNEYKENLIKNETSLKTHIESMFKTSTTLTQEAKNFAQILKGDKKIRGNFAELQLKNVLESSSLIENEQFKLQAHFENEGRKYFADAVVFLDKKRNMIIDSKFSLANFSPDLELNNEYKQEIAKNLKERIKELHSKPYEKYNEYTSENLILFIPYQNILDIALEVDSSILQFAYDRKIYLTTPNTLFMALKTISISWIQMDSNKKIQEAFNEIGKFYDKFSGTIEDFKRLKANFGSLGKSIESMETKIAGRGGLVSHVEKLKTLGAKTNKEIDSSFLDLDKTEIIECEAIEENKKIK